MIRLTLVATAAGFFLATLFIWAFAVEIMVTL